MTCRVREKKMELSITTDYLMDKLSPEPCLKHIADTGFTHIHWGHHWGSDFIYSKSEIGQIKRWLNGFGLKMVDLHASHGIEKNWVSLHDYERVAGVKLVKNRISMAARLGAGVINLHIPKKEPESETGKKLFQVQLRRSLDELEPFAKKHNVRIALENLVGQKTDIHQKLFSEYEPEFLGLCFDSGHANVDESGFELLNANKDRLLSLHLNDNDGVDSLYHDLLFSGTTDWPLVAAAIAESSYSKCASMEVMMNRKKFKMEEEFLKKVFETGSIFSEMLSQTRNYISGSA